MTGNPRSILYFWKLPFLNPVLLSIVLLYFHKPLYTQIPSRKSAQLPFHRCGLVWFTFWQTLSNVCLWWNAFSIHRQAFWAPSPAPAGMRPPTRIPSVPTWQELSTASISWSRPFSPPPPRVLPTDSRNSIYVAATDMSPLGLWSLPGNASTSGRECGVSSWIGRRNFRV